MSRALRLQPPAKLNLALRVVGRRPDGFHELETVFCAIDVRDELIARRSARGASGWCHKLTLRYSPTPCTTW